MSRRGWYISALPRLRILAELKLDSSAIDHGIFVLEPVLCPLFPVDLHALHVDAVVQPDRGDAERFIPVNCHV